MADLPDEGPAWVRRVNGLATSIGGPRALVALEPDELIEHARRATGLDDFGEPTWVEPFRRVAAALDGEAELNVMGRLMCRHDLIRHLTTRLAVLDAHRSRPELTAEPVVRPVVITGPARSGTSILHELLALDPGLRAPLAYEMAHPCATVDDATRATWAESEFDLWGDVRPEFRAVHDLEARLPEECLWMLAPEFDSGYWSTCVAVPSFSAWSVARDHTIAYRFHRRFLQVLQAGEPTRWVLKSPVHLSRLAALLDVYPDAFVIRTHRDPVKTVPSTASAVAVGRRVRSDAVDGHSVAATVGFGLRMILNASATDTSLPSDQVTDLQYLDLLRDPVGALRRVYAAMGREFPPPLQQAVLEYLARRPQGQHGPHRYDAASFGLDPQEIRDGLAPYVERFGVESETG